MNDSDRLWMEYIDQEVRAFCEKRNWQHQIRRNEWVREQPVAESPVDDYEWKIYPYAKGETPPYAVSWLMNADRWEGIYYVLFADRTDNALILQYDTAWCGIRGLHWDRETRTIIRYGPPHQAAAKLKDESTLLRLGPPQAGWLRDHLLELTTPTVKYARIQLEEASVEWLREQLLKPDAPTHPNHFSKT